MYKYSLKGDSGTAWTLHIGTSVQDIGVFTVYILTGDPDHTEMRKLTASSSWFAWFFKHQFRSLKIVTHNHLMARFSGQMS